jgi:hypothetical protein
MPAAKGSVPWNAGKGAGWTDKRGYRWLYVDENGRQRARREHRVIMERHIGRRLEPWEIVHHKDGNPTNNALDNLEVQEHGAHTAAHSTGSRRSQEARRSMEAFALMREELRAERLVRADLLAALKALVSEKCEDTGDGWAELTARIDDVEQARAAIASATGENA